MNTAFRALTFDCQHRSSNVFDLPGDGSHKYGLRRLIAASMAFVATATPTF